MKTAAFFPSYRPGAGTTDSKSGTQRVVPGAHLPHTAYSSLQCQGRDDGQWHRQAWPNEAFQLTSSEFLNVLAHPKEREGMLNWKEN